MYGHVGHHILHEEEEKRRRNNALAYDQKEDEILLYFPFYVKHHKDYTKTTWLQGISIEAVTEDKLWGFILPSTSG